jgi:hypothetical protein
MELHEDTGLREPSAAMDFGAMAWEADGVVGSSGVTRPWTSKGNDDAFACPSSPGFSISKVSNYISI